MQLKKKLYTLKEAFGDDYPADMRINGFEIQQHPNKHPFQRDKSKIWLWDKNILSDLIIWWLSGYGEPLHIFGPPGSGKSETVYNFAASIGVPVYEVTVHGQKEFQELVIDRDLIDGTTINNYAALTLAMGVENAPGILVLNEIDKGDGHFHAGLFEVLTGKPIAVNNGGLEYIKPDPYFRIITTGNTSMLGDHYGNHPSSEQCDMAFVDRFWKIKHDYPSEEFEADIIKQHAPNIEVETIKVMIDFANDVRANSVYLSAGIDASPITLTTRTLIRWAKAMYAYRNIKREGTTPLYHSLDISLVNATDGRPEWRKSIVELAKGKFG